jgi:hypothetical protein
MKPFQFQELCTLIEQVSVVIRLYTCILEVLGSNYSIITRYSELAFYEIFQSVQVSYIKMYELHAVPCYIYISRPVPSKFLLIRYFLSSW